MAQQVLETPVDAAALVEHLVTEDDTPVDNLFSEKQQHFLTEPLYSSWMPPVSAEHPTTPRRFIVAANVGIFSPFAVQKVQKLHFLGGPEFLGRLSFEPMTCSGYALFQAAPAWRRRVP